MARMARVVVAGIPHHVVQRGNRRQQTFFNDGDYQMYLQLMSEWCGRYGIDIWAYCLMPNHVHLIAVPQEEDGLRQGIGEVHRRYTRHINFREGWRGHLWQGRFSSYVMDERHLLAAARYIELNPVRARIVVRPDEYEWSSAKAHLAGQDDRLVKARPILEIAGGGWKEFLAADVMDEELRAIRHHERTGRPLGEGGFVEKLEIMTGRYFRKKKPGPKLKEEGN